MGHHGCTTPLPAVRGRGKKGRRGGLEELALHALQTWETEDPMLGAQANMGSHSEAKSETGNADIVTSTPPRTSPKRWQGPMPAPRVCWRGQVSTAQE